MPLNLIPQSPAKKDKKSRIGALMLKKAREPKKLLYLGTIIGAIILLVIFYVIIRSYQSSLAHKLKVLDDKIVAAEQEKRSLQAKSEIGDFQTKLDLLKKLIEKHVYWTSLFDFLEGITLPKVRYISFNADISSNKLNLDGTTIGFTTLAQQMIILKRNPLVKNLTMSSLKITEEGIGFNFNIELSPKAWQEVKEQKNES